VGKPLVRFCEGQENNCRYGKDLVAPPRKQAANRENKYFPVASGGSCLLEKEIKSEYRILNVECRRNVFFLFYKIDRAKRNHPSKFCGSLLK